VVLNFACAIGFEKTELVFNSVLRENQRVFRQVAAESPSARKTIAFHDPFMVPRFDIESLLNAPFRLAATRATL
jgi:hypothetical protein